MKEAVWPGGAPSTCGEMNTLNGKILLGDWEQVDCAICETDFPKKVILPDGEYGDIAQCQKCDLVFRSPRRSQSYLDHHFASEWTEARPELFLENYREKSLTLVAQWVQESCPNSGAILDVGSSHGALLAKFPDSWRLVGVDPSAVACRIARKRLPQAEILNKTIIEAPLQEMTFDVITMMDTLYYLPYPVRDLLRIRELLKPDGMLLIKCQSFTNRGRVYLAMGCRFDESWMYFYTPSTLAKLLLKANLKVVARFDLPGSQVGANNRVRRAITWLEFSLSRAVARISGYKLDFIPHFVLVARRA
jgi:SAM-dependent methyltransferase